jgi:hypothetical protein
VRGKPVAAIVALDGAYSGNAGIAVLTRPEPGGSFVHAYRDAPLLNVATQRWLGDQVNAVCRPGERVVLVAEQDAFGGMGVARKLGIGIGSVEGLLIDLNAMEEDTRVDVTTTTWRTVVELRDGTRIAKGGGRPRAKALAIAYVNERFGLALQGNNVNAAEAICIGCWYDREHPEWGTHVRPVPATPTGMRPRTFQRDGK